MAEILAPAGTYEALVAAVRNGADAVYFGTGNFNARRNASNFNGDELKKAIEFCHLHGVKCHIALNTLVADREIEDLKETVKRICEFSADALIVQDLGVAEIVHNICPEMPLHASTQMSTGTVEGLKLLKDIGFTRAVLPRELSESEILTISQNTDIELEMFVHGALCMCVSGQCLMSAMLGSRSGNRGLCAQPCRLPFKVPNGTGNDLSLKDLSLIDNIVKLSELGISSFKIEGRMKRPEYVAAAVTACREALDGNYNDARRSELKSLFSRSGFTDGYFTSQTGRNMFGSREKENVTSATNELLKKYAHTYEKEKTVYKADFIFTAFEGEKMSLSAAADNKNVFCESDTICEKAINRPATASAIENQLEKCGGTVFSAGVTECDIGEDVSVPVSQVNALRRDALQKLTTLLSQGKQYKIADYKKNITTHISQSPKTYMCFYDENAIPDGIECDKIFLPLECNKSSFEKYNAGVIIPRGIFSNYDEVLKKVQNSGAKYALCNTLDAVALCRQAGVKIIGGAFLNVFNSVSAQKMKALGVDEITLSHELTLTQISKLAGDIPRGVVAYGRTPLMITKNCPVKNGKTCAQCQRKSSITDRMGIEFPVLCSNGFSEIFNSRPVYMAERLTEIKNVDFLMLVFTTESKTQCADIIRKYKNYEKSDCEFTRGLFYRGVE